jgi:hypothetical protein
MYSGLAGIVNRTARVPLLSAPTIDAISAAFTRRIYFRLAKIPNLARNSFAEASCHSAKNLTRIGGFFRGRGEPIGDGAASGVFT